MFLDTNFNSPNTVLSTIYQNFVEAAMKYYRYGKSMEHRNQPHLELLTGETLHSWDGQVYRLDKPLTVIDLGHWLKM